MMKNLTRLALAAAFACGGNLAACSDDGDKSCETSDDCDDNETCDTGCDFGGTCKVACTDETQCAGELCMFDGEGCTVKSCSAAILDCDDRTFSTCYEHGLYCNSYEALCERIPHMSCSPVFPSYFSPDANGPMIYHVERVGECVADDETHCGGGTSCAFDVQFWDPDADVDAEKADVKYIQGDGTLDEIGFVDPATIQTNFGSVRVYTCVGTSPVVSPRSQDTLAGGNGVA